MSSQHTVAEIRRMLEASHGTELADLLSQLASDERAGVRSSCAAARAREARAEAVAAHTRKLYALETSLRAEGVALIAGVDEVGRGAIAGPLTVAAVMLPADPCIDGLDDSKRLSARRREELAGAIGACAISVAVAHVDAGRIDAVGITGALRQAVLEAVSRLDPQPERVLIDGLALNVLANETAIVKGDATVAAIAAASIVAKVARDALMREYAASHPVYGLDINKGYGTPEHIEAVVRFGPCELHRRSFSSGGGTAPLF